MTTPWYKEKWSWFVFFIPLATIVGCMVTITMANKSGFTMVVDDYYKQGKAINLELEREKRAAALGLVADLQINNSEVKVAFSEGDPGNTAAIKVSLFHATLAHKDTSFVLTADAQGTYTQQTNVDLTGKWLITIQPFDGDWKLKRKITLPVADSLVFAP